MWVSIVMLVVILAVAGLIAAVVVIGQQGRYSDRVGSGVSDRLTNAASVLNGENDHLDIPVVKLGRR